MVARIVDGFLELLDDGLRRGDVRISHPEIDDIFPRAARLHL
jgi:hypothetical protein